MKRFRCVRALAVAGGLAALFDLTVRANRCDAAVQLFSDRSLWQAAAGAASFTEDFSSFAADVSFQSAGVALAGMTISREGPEPGLTNFIDVPPLMFGGGSGTSQAELFTNFNEGANIGTQVRIAFDQPVVAFGYDAWAAADFEGARMIIYDGPFVQEAPAVPGGNGAFSGFVMVGGSQATSVLFESLTLIVGTTGEGFAVDNLAGVFVPEPATITLMAMLAGTGVTVARRRRPRAPR